MLCIPNSFGALLLKVGAVKTLNLFNVCLTILVPKLKGTFHFSKSEPLSKNHHIKKYSNEF